MLAMPINGWSSALSVKPAPLMKALRKNNENPALKHFFKLIEERYPG